MNYPLGFSNQFLIPIPPKPHKTYKPLIIQIPTKKV